ncbi:hypothetical protein MJG53_009032 [Ovis ammon polii x Ovis aries]|uniref:Uncharacterized protein n=1 Tax=Ovis ammon polii x Ovis aries TaxID=2918886 RepID=A0ACB9UXY7_9CETA|nr:hypothetical protein MJT46_008666 [Ovis ammon polii x Ovis aries]KAI4582481.1 hypothetical protein MJG53_009032 [Ovis ammon polii x Ovis aries]
MPFHQRTVEPARLRRPEAAGAADAPLFRSLEQEAERSPWGAVGRGGAKVVGKGSEERSLLEEPGYWMGGLDHNPKREE